MGMQVAYHRSFPGEVVVFVVSWEFKGPIPNPQCHPGKTHTMKCQVVLTQRSAHSETSSSTWSTAVIHTVHLSLLQQTPQAFWAHGVFESQHSRF